MNAQQLPPFVSMGWVLSNREDLRLVDTRWSLDGSVGRDDWLRGHLPGAVHADLDEDLSGPPGGTAGRHPLPDPDDFALAMQRLGVHDSTPVVAYDTVGGGIAARLAWMLRILDHPAAVLDFRHDDVGSVWEDGEVDVPTGSFSPRPWPPEAIATLEEVGALAPGVTLVDARTAERYRGDHEPVDPRAGHIPGAVNLPWTDNLERDRIASADVLRRRFRDAGVGTDTVVYCGSGVTACHDALAIEAAGLGRPRVFVGSFSAWAADAGREVATEPRSDSDEVPADPVA